MRNQSLNAGFLFLTVLALVAAARIAEINGEASSRQPASYSHKEALLGEPKPAGLKHTHKIRGPLRATVNLASAPIEKIGDVFVLFGSIESSQDLTDVEYKWALPDGVELVNGEATGTISFLNADQPYQVQISLKAKDLDNQQVHLLTAGAKNGIRFADSIQYNTLIDPVVHANKEAMLKSTSKEGAKANSLKVFH
jgi:hypothetical protein